MTNKLEILERSPVSTSVRPSLKYSWSESLLILTKGRTMSEGLSGSGSAAGAAWVLGVGCWVLGARRERDQKIATARTTSTNPAINGLYARRTLPVFALEL